MGLGRSLIFGVTTLLAAAPASAGDDFQQWLTVSARGEVAPKVVLQTEGIARFSEDRGGLYQLQGIAHLGYEIRKGIIVWAGYVQSHEYRDGDLTVERRIREQITFDNIAKIGRASLSARVRLEQRWRDIAPGTAWRIRPQLRLSIPLGDKTAPSLQLSEEGFFNLNEATFQASEGLERSRTAAVISIPLSPAVRGDIGYLNQHRFVRDGPDSDEHALTLALGFAF
ncbi:DUF2490 domain-containing protein [Qipengyuania sediminis]|uniref:DUF2490 domain-containing protein n=1 Tax=Qipengyuania sediminis TaxID=1532023 RepID=UPI00197E4007|nr:DUF2490 domain-containing protein [Qipengyuania sediminis]